MAMRCLLSRASRPPSCLLHGRRQKDAEVAHRLGRKPFASLASYNSDSSSTNSPPSSSPSAATKSQVENPTAMTMIKSSSSKNNNNNNNANPNEVNKFSSFASRWWDSRSNPLVGMNPIRIKFLREVVDTFQPSLSPLTSSSLSSQKKLSPLHNKRILDIGCGGGLLTESLSRLGASLVVGLDASAHVVEVAKRHSFHENSRLIRSDDGDYGRRNGIHYIGATVEELASYWLAAHENEQALLSASTSSSSTSPQQHDLFDIITALEIIEHVPNPSSLLSAAQSLLKPNGGILIVSTINRTVKSYGLAIIAAEYILGKVPIGTHSWDMFCSPTEVEQMVMMSCHTNSNGKKKKNQQRIMMKPIALSGMVLQPPFINMEWILDEKDTDVNWIGAYQKQG